MKNKLGTRILIVLAVAATIFIAVALLLYRGSATSDMRGELGKAFMELGVSAIVGGFIKFLFDKYQLKETELKEDALKREEVRRREADFRRDILNRLRKVFDDVDSAKLLIEAHRSARTYGERIRMSIIPSITALYDTKRSLADSVNMMPQTNIRHLRLNLHYMIAYLQALADEYRDQYLAISNLQFFEEGWKTSSRDKILLKFLNDHPGAEASSVSFEMLAIPSPPMKAWERIEELPVVGKLVADDVNSLYRALFVEFYEYSKRILKEQEMQRLPGEWDEHFLTELDELDEKKASGTVTRQDNLVADIMRRYFKP